MGYNITGIGPVPSNVAEYTTGEVQQKYLQYVNILKQIFDKRADNPDPNSQTLTASDYTTLITTLQNLKTLAQNGATDPLSGAQFYLTSDMAIDLDLILRSLSASGINVDSFIGDPQAQMNAMKNWQSLAGFGVEDILTQATSITGGTRTLQSMIELEYVKEGNDLLSTTLGGLQDQLTTTQGILDTLTVIQNIANQITVMNPGDFAFPPQTDGQIPSSAIHQLDSLIGNNLYGTWTTDVATAKAQALANHTSFSTEMAKLHAASDIIKNYVGNDSTHFINTYKIMASAQFRQIFPTASPTSTAANDLLNAKQKLMQELADLEKQNPGATRSTAGSLASFIYRVALDVSSHFSGINTQGMSSAALKTALSAAVSAWILDNQNQKAGSQAANSAGSIQNNLTQAISAGESLNDQQKQLVQNYMFIFQQFYQSASDVLQKVNQVIQKHAQGIAR
ncbi:hypothetical protein [Candidatus Protochlamydia phocaeensis]|uniref:hypothetical protein n=1 Tax=Candidatus Protochlamydia phocaeensis TaxID=1414722 RepID=UPI000838D6CE|nr:hypothetical protein [Candidatus Protochlamydia phocaeensis]